MYAIVLMARNGPNGIRVFLFLLKNIIPIMPTHVAKHDPMKSVNQQPIGPTKEPIKANSSKSPEPIPCLPVIR